MSDERWKIAFFKALSLDNIVQLANLANYLNIPELIDSCLEVIAIEMRNATDRALVYDPSLKTMTADEDKRLREKYSWAYN